MPHSNLPAKRVFPLSNAAFAVEILDRISRVGLTSFCYNAEQVVGIVHISVGRFREIAQSDC